MLAGRIQRGATVGLLAGIGMLLIGTLRFAVSLARGIRTDFTGLGPQVVALLLAFTIGGALLGIVEPLRHSAPGRFIFAALGGAMFFGWVLSLEGGPPWHWSYLTTMVWGVGTLIAALIGGAYLSITAPLDESAAKSSDAEPPDV